MTRDTEKCSLSVLPGVRIKWVNFVKVFLALNTRLFPNPYYSKSSFIIIKVKLPVLSNFSSNEILTNA